MAATKADLSKLNDLAANLDSRLMGGLHGEFYEEGSKLGDKNRHEQLATLFELKKHISSIQAEMQKQQRPEDEERKNSKAPVKGNANLVSTIKSVIDQEMAGKLRDFEIKFDRLSERCKKAEDSNAALAAKNHALEQEMKKLKQQSKTEKITDGKFNTLQNQMTRLEQNHVTEGRMQALESQVTNQRQVTGAKLLALENTVTPVEQAQLTESRMQVLESQVTTVQQRQDFMHEALQTVSNILDRDRNTTDENAALCARNERSTLRDIRRLERREGENRDRIRALEAQPSTHIETGSARFERWQARVCDREQVLKLLADFA
jgi:hypothetical protein